MGIDGKMNNTGSISNSSSNSNAETNQNRNGASPNVGATVSNEIPSTPNVPDSGSQSGSIAITKETLSQLVQNKQTKQLAAYGGAKALASKLGSSAQTGFPAGFDFVAQQDKFGRNYVPPPRQQWYVELLWGALQDTTILMLLASSVVSLILGLAVEKNFSHGWIEGVSILVSVAVVINVQSVTDYTKAKEFRRQQMELENQQVSHVIRNGKSVEVSPRDLVVGDVLRFAVGDILAVDCVLIEGADIKMDESALTGETKLVTKTVLTLNTSEQKHEKESSHLKNDPFLVSGTNVMSGSGLALAVAVGENSVQGSILAAVGRDASNSATNKKSASQKGDETKPVNNVSTAKSSSIEDELLVNEIIDEVAVEGGNLVDKLDHFAMMIGKFGFTVAGIALFIMLIKFAVIEFKQDDSCKDFKSNATCNAESNGNPEDIDLDICEWRETPMKCIRVWNTGHDLSEILEFFVTAITILVVVIPEGLPLAVTLSLAVSMRRMMKDNNQVKYMDACETMGSATTICSDKTGTLTINKMTVVKCALGDKLTDFTKPVASQQSFGENIAHQLRTNAQIDRVEPILNMMAYNAFLNSAATSRVFIKDGSQNRDLSYAGNATECALIKFAIELGFDMDAVRTSKLFNDPTGSCSDWGTFMFPFSSEKKRMSIVVPVQDIEGVGYRLFSKGAPKGILDSCSFIVKSNSAAPECALRTKDVENQVITDDEIIKLTSEVKEKVVAKISEFQKHGLRCIALAFKDIKKKPEKGWKTEPKKGEEDQHHKNEVEEDMILLGIVGIEDPLRPEIIEAIRKCNRAGVDVRMCTGDALETAISIAVKSGILKPNHLEPNEVNKPKPDFAMTGPEFIERVIRQDKTKPKAMRKVFDFSANDVIEREEYPFMTNEIGDKVIDQKILDSIWPKLRVLARCQPQDKYILVTGLRNSKVFEDKEMCSQLKKDFDIDIFHDRQVVAVTGDGTNDAPALKKADVGFAMGITGTETAKQAADILLLDDNFNSIVKAVMWGRNVYDAISKFVQFQLTVNISAVVVAVLGAIVVNQSPLRPVQMLWVNLIMDSLASLALATDPPSEFLLDRKPYGRKRKILSEVMLFNILGQACYQIIVLLIILFAPNILPGDVEDNSDFEKTQLASDGFGSVHWTIFFNTFVQMQIFNEFNSRKLQDVSRLRHSWQEWNVFENITQNNFFIAIFASTFILQVLIVQFGGAAFTLADGGLNGPQWAFSILVGAASLIWQIIIINPTLYLFGVEDPEFDELVTPNVKDDPKQAFRTNILNRQRETSRWKRLKKRLGYGFLLSGTIDSGEVTASNESLRLSGILRRGENRPNHDYLLTKQESKRLEVLLKRQGRSMMHLDSIKEKDEDEENEKDQNNVDSMQKQ